MPGTDCAYGNAVQSRASGFWTGGFLAGIRSEHMRLHTKHGRAGTNCSTNLALGEVQIWDELYGNGG
eukprot:2577349-Rhodomonas_salina.2